MSSATAPPTMEYWSRRRLGMFGRRRAVGRRRGGSAPAEAEHREHRQPADRRLVRRGNVRFSDHSGVRGLATG